MDTRRNELELVLLAVQEGVLSHSHVQECLRDREERESSTGKPDPRPLIRIAMEKGLLNQARLQDITTRQGAPRPGPTVVMIDISMECPSCGATSSLPLAQAIGHPRCSRCSSVLRSRRPAAASDRPSGPQGLLPEEVRKAAEDSKNRFSKYILVSRLGLGGMGEVYKAWDTVLQRKVAIKFPRSVGEDEIRRLYVEAQGAGRLSHPNIASVYEIAEAEGRHYIAMQYIDGATAEKCIETMGGKRDVREIVRWIRDAALAAHYAHQNSVIHRDLKPQNLMIDAGGRVYVMDFGLAKVLSTTGDATVSGMILGTPSFMPPEQAAGHVSEIGPASDVYSLGATLYVMLSGKRPYEGVSVTDVLVHVLTSDPPPLRQVDPSLPREIEAIVEKAMRKPREHRYASAQELADDLTNFLQNQPVKARSSTVTYRFYRKFSRYRAQVIMAAIFAVILGAVILATVLRSPPSPPPPAVEPAEEWKALFGEIRNALSIDTFRGPAAAAPLLARAERDFPRNKVLVDEFVEGQHRILINILENLPRERWLDSQERVGRYRAWLAFANKDTAAAEKILKYRGTCSIRIHVHPYAEVRGTFASSLPPQERFTPLALLDVEIADGEIEISHPTYGSRSIPVRGLRNGGAYLLEGKWESKEDLQLKEGK